MPDEERGRVMRERGANADPARPDAWAPLADALLGGLVHALSNRVASLGAVAAMASEGDAIEAELAGEIERMGRLLRLFRMLAASPLGGDVALDAGQLLADAVELHAMHGELRDVAAELECDADLPPLLAPEGAATRAVLLVLAGAKAAALARGARVVRVRCRAEPGRAVVELGPPWPQDHGPRPAGEPPTTEGRAAAALARAFGGAARDDGEGRYALTLPTIQPRGAAPHG